MAEDEDEDTEVEGGACTNSKDLNFWKKSGRKSFDGSLNQCGRSCAAGFACTKSCMQAREGKHIHLLICFAEFQHHP